VSTKKNRLGPLIDRWRGKEGDPHYVGYFDLFNRGLFYDAHDVLEQLWLADRHGPNGAFFKGLIQLAGAFVHLQKTRLKPSVALFKLADANFQKYPARHEKLDLTAARELIARWVADIEKSGFEKNPLVETNRPHLHWPA
jgi:predicted metal-dependent hydrolase